MELAALRFDLKEVAGDEDGDSQEDFDRSWCTWVHGVAGAAGAERADEGADV